MKKLLGTFAILLVVCIISALGLDIVLKNQSFKPITPTVKNDPGIEYFSDEEELLSYINEHFVYHYDYDYEIVYEESMITNGLMPEAPIAVAPTAPAESDSVSKNESVSASDTAEDVSSTNVQVEGVDEGDILKTDGNYIYLINDSYLTIVDISGKEPKEVSVTDLKLSNGYVYINEMYIKDDIAILISNENIAEEKRYNDLSNSNVEDPTGTYVPYPYIYTQYTNYTVVSIYDISNREKPIETRKIAFEGSLVSSREMNGKLYIVNNKYFKNVFNKNKISAFYETTFFTNFEKVLCFFKVNLRIGYAPLLRLLFSV